MQTTLLISALLVGGVATLAPVGTQDCPATKSRAALASHEDKADIVDTALAAGDFKTLAAALKAADLVDALRGPGPFTVFAPTDAAFAKLPEGTVAHLLKPENKAALQTILTYHVVAGDVRAKDVVRLKTADTLSGQRVDVRFDKKTKQVLIDTKIVQINLQDDFEAEIRWEGIFQAITGNGREFLGSAPYQPLSRYNQSNITDYTTLDPATVPDTWVPCP